MRIRVIGYVSDSRHVYFTIRRTGAYADFLRYGQFGDSCLGLRKSRQLRLRKQKHDSHGGTLLAIAENLLLQRGQVWVSFSAP